MSVFYCKVYLSVVLLETVFLKHGADLEHYILRRRVVGSAGDKEGRQK